MKARVQVLLTEEERERFRSRAAAEGLSLSAWLREAGMERMERGEAGQQIGSAEELDAFFTECDRRAAGKGAEPSWEEHREVIRGSRGGGISGT